jgi:hypothetical protein
MRWYNAGGEKTRQHIRQPLLTALLRPAVDMRIRHFTGHKNRKGDTNALAGVDMECGAKIRMNLKPRDRSTYSISSSKLNTAWKSIMTP